MKIATLATLSAVFALLVPAVAVSELVAGRAAPTAIDIGAPLAEAPEYPSGHLLRCWQYGRLLFEEVVQTLPEDGAPYRMALNDSARSPVMILETKSATCLLRPNPGPLRRKP